MVAAYVTAWCWYVWIQIWHGNKVSDIKNKTSLDAGPLPYHPYASYITSDTKDANERILMWTQNLYTNTKTIALHSY